MTWKLQHVVLQALAAVATFPIPVLLFLLLLCPTRRLVAQSSQGLPREAQIIEQVNVPSAIHPHRTLVLWMLNPKRNPRDTSDDIYTCPEYTRGSYYSGPTRVSLIDSSTNKVVNTIKVALDYEGGEDSLDLPYNIRAGYYYRVGPLSRKVRQGKPMIMWLRDYNGDGKALEFVLFNAQACMGLDTALIGYTRKQDKVIQYSVQMDIVDQGKHSKSMQLWADYLFSREPIRKGYWKYEIDYRGRGGSLDKWEVHFNAFKEQFEATMIRVTDEP